MLKQIQDGGGPPS